MVGHRITVGPSQEHQGGTWACAEQLGVASQDAFEKTAPEISKTIAEHFRTKRTSSMYMFNWKPATKHRYGQSYHFRTLHMAIAVCISKEYHNFQFKKKGNKSDTNSEKLRSSRDTVRTFAQPGHNGSPPLTLKFALSHSLFNCTRRDWIGKPQGQARPVAATSDSSPLRHYQTPTRVR